MCSLSYIPPQGAQPAILTFNRDEQPHRAARELAKAELRIPINGSADAALVRLLYPRIPSLNGTWLATNGAQFVCLLNGAFVPHEHRPPYRHSRGKVVFDAFGFATLLDLYQQYDLENIEPFTLLSLQTQHPDTLDPTTVFEEVRWDGERRYYRALEPTRAAFWSSATLYPPAVASVRQAWFDAFLLEHPHTTPADLLEFHRTGGDATDPRNSLVMSLPEYGVETISTTQIRYGGGNTEMMHYNLLEPTPTNSEQMTWAATYQRLPSVEYV